MKKNRYLPLWFSLFVAAATSAGPVAFAANDPDQPVQYAPIRIDNDHGLSLRLPKDENVVYRGVVSFDKAGLGQGAMLYPVPGAAGLLAAIITHGLISESAKNSQKEKIQLEADKVLEPYKDLLATFKYKDLMAQGLDKAVKPLNKRVIENAATAQSEWLVVSAPIFFMTQDRRAIVMDNTIAIYAKDAYSVPKYQNTIRVVSHAKEESEAAEFWADQQGEKLKAESVVLFTQSLDIAMNEAESDTSKNNPAYKTVRYFEGGQEKMERAQLMKEGCKRNVIKTLRGGLMSVPAQANSAPEKCAEISSNQ